MDADDVEALLAAGEVWRLSRTRATALARAVRADPKPLLDALEADGFLSEAAQVREALAGRLTEQQEEVARVVARMQEQLLKVALYEPSWVLVALYEQHPELRGAVDLATTGLPQHSAAMASWRAGQAVMTALLQSQSSLDQRSPPL